MRCSQMSVASVEIYDYTYGIQCIAVGTFVIYMMTTVELNLLPYTYFSACVQTCSATNHLFIFINLLRCIGKDLVRVCVDDIWCSHQDHCHHVLQFIQSLSSIIHVYLVCVHCSISTLYLHILVL